MSELSILIDGEWVPASALPPGREANMTIFDSEPDQEFGAEFNAGDLEVFVDVAIFRNPSSFQPKQFNCRCIYTELQFVTGAPKYLQDTPLDDTTPMICASRAGSLWPEPQPPCQPEKPDPDPSRVL